MSPDAELLHAAHAGHAPSLGRLLDRHRPRLLAIALRMLGYGPQAEDAVHDAFLIALRKLDTLSDPLALQGWLDAIVRNVCRMSLRNARTVSLDEDRRRIDPEAVLDDPGAEIDRLALRDWVWKSLATLPEALRVTVLLRHFSGFPAYEQIAEFLGIPVGTVRSRLADARRRLSERLLESPQSADPAERQDREEWNQFYVDAFSRLYDGRRDEFVSHFRSDMDVVVGGKRFPGRGKLEFEVDGDLRTGTLTEPVRIHSSGNLSVLDCAITNPPEDPTRCPEAMAIVVCRQGPRSNRVYLYPGERLPRSTG